MSSAWFGYFMLGCAIVALAAYFRLTKALDNDGTSEAHDG